MRFISKINKTSRVAKLVSSTKGAHTYYLPQKRHVLHIDSYGIIVIFIIVNDAVHWPLMVNITMVDNNICRLGYYYVYIPRPKTKNL